MFNFQSCATLYSGQYYNVNSNLEIKSDINNKCDFALMWAIFKSQFKFKSNYLKMEVKMKIVSDIWFSKTWPAPCWTMLNSNKRNGAQSLLHLHLVTALLVETRIRMQSDHALQIKFTFSHLQSPVLQFVGCFILVSTEYAMIELCFAKAWVWLYLIRPSKGFSNVYSLFYYRFTGPLNISVHCCLQHINLLDLLSNFLALWVFLSFFFFSPSLTVIPKANAISVCSLCLIITGTGYDDKQRRAK